MPIIHRYITRMFFKFFGIVLVMVIAIYLSVDVFGKMDNLLDAELRAMEMALYFVYKVPLIVSQITPVAVLLSVLIVFGLMSKNNEVVALKSSGVSLQYLLMPVLGIGLLLSAGLFIFSEAFVPITISRAFHLEEGGSANKAMMTSREKNIWLRHHRGITHIQYFHPAEKIIYGVSTMFFDGEFHLSRRIDAEKGVYQGGQWTFFSAMVQHFDGAAGTPDSTFYDKKKVDLPLKPGDLKRVAKSAEEMNFSRLWHYIRKAERNGYDATHYKVDFYAKTAFPVVCLIMCLIGSAIALRGKTREGMAVSFAYGIVTAFVYWSLYSFCLSLGYGEILPPLFAAWMANLIFICIAGFMVLNLE
ncbi:MAG: LPS export ABC transporter permease LptG [Desulfobacterales bacterium]|nr:LPS export ABC transporter permease LptG [Desulfobacterales bacterium]